MPEDIFGDVCVCLQLCAAVGAAGTALLHSGGCGCCGYFGTPDHSELLSAWMDAPTHCSKWKETVYLLVRHHVCVSVHDYVFGSVISYHYITVSEFYLLHAAPFTQKGHSNAYTTYQSSVGQFTSHELSSTDLMHLTSIHLGYRHHVMIRFPTIPTIPSWTDLTTNGPLEAALATVHLGIGNLLF